MTSLRKRTSCYAAALTLVTTCLLLLPIDAPARSTSVSWDNGGTHAHGTITPSRTVLTPAGQIVLLDGIYGDALSHLRYSRVKLWLEFGIATASGASRLNERADLAQAALAAVMLILGRPLRADEYLTGLSGVLREIVDIAQIRSTTSFAIGSRRVNKSSKRRSAYFQCAM